MSQSLFRKGSKVEIRESDVEVIASASATGSRSHFREFMESFKRDGAVTVPSDLEYDELTEEEKVQWDLATQPYKKVLDQRHLTMIAIGALWEQVFSLDLGYLWLLVLVRF